MKQKSNKPQKRTNSTLLSALGFGKPAFKYTGSIRPGTITPQRLPSSLPPSIILPNYAHDGIPKTINTKTPWEIEVKDEETIANMKVAAKVAREVLDIAGKHVKVGVSTEELDQIVFEETIKRNAYPSPLNYHGFPKSCCTSINEIVCHGIPSSTTILNDGDIVNIDVTCYIHGVHGDMSETFLVGENVDETGKLLVKAAWECMEKGIESVEIGKGYNELGEVIEKHAKEYGFSSVRNFCGHGIGSYFHGNPNVLHYKNTEPNGKIAVGHTFTVEPMICEGTARNVMWPDKWTAATADGKRSAQFEHTVLVTENGPVRLTDRIIGKSQKFWWE
eukprot:CAMPEP_0182450478 /NCGR_PEP_ID=MMETSP1172-20130603/41508_1 /TAXON_ID=708627 /ORGANISM="Timspurckia oligopyrenoides, Strain CCMP3278" /LENGTH=332 /DNA_ID=CAMNT_0024648095 /DNA_START=135 /DNA_END=1133 /DNA_ORIENTATION=-